MTSKQKMAEKNKDGKRMNLSVPETQYALGEENKKRTPDILNRTPVIDQFPHDHGRELNEAIEASVNVACLPKTLETDLTKIVPEIQYASDEENMKGTPCILNRTPVIDQSLHDHGTESKEAIEASAECRLAKKLESDLIKSSNARERALHEEIKDLKEVVFMIKNDKKGLSKKLYLSEAHAKGLCSRLEERDLDVNNLQRELEREKNKARRKMDSKNSDIKSLRAELYASKSNTNVLKMDLVAAEIDHVEQEKMRTMLVDVQKQVFHLSTINRNLQQKITSEKTPRKVKSPKRKPNKEKTTEKSVKCFDWNTLLAVAIGFCISFLFLVNFFFYDLVTRNM